MSYTPWSVSFGEQPSASKWNLLGANDASFNDGSGIANSSLSTTSLSNPYKFSVYANTSWNFTDTTVPFDTKVYDTNTSFNTSTHIYTAPVAGFYHFNAGVQALNPVEGNVVLLSLCVNGTSETRRLGERYIKGTSTGNEMVSGGTDVQLSASNTVRITVRNNDSITGSTGNNVTWFAGHLVSHT